MLCRLCNNVLQKWRHTICSVVVINNISWYCNKNFKNATEFTLCFVLLLFSSVYHHLRFSDRLTTFFHQYVFTNFSHWYFSVSWKMLKIEKKSLFTDNIFVFFFNWEILVEKLMKKIGENMWWADHSFPYLLSHIKIAIRWWHDLYFLNFPSSAWKKFTVFTFLAQILCEIYGGAEPKF